MIRPVSSSLFFVLALFFTGAGAFWSLDSFREYRAEVSVLVQPQNSTGPAEQIVENIAFLPTTISFFDALLASDERLTEFSDLDEQPITVRKAAWKNMFSVKREPGSGVVTYAIDAKSQEEAVLLARQLSKTLFEKIGAYYDIRSEVSLRLIEGPLVRTSIATPVLWIGLSIGGGIVLALVVTVLFSAFVPFSVWKHTQATWSSRPSFQPSTFIPRKPAALFSEASEAKAHEEKWNQVLETQEIAARKKETVEKEILEQLVAPKSVPMTHVSAPSVTASAPANLPVMDEATFLAQFATETEGANREVAEEAESRTAPAPSEVMPEEAPLPSEPTVEDYRRRLNELLRQGK